MVNLTTLESGAKTIIPFVERILPSSKSESPVIAREILGIVASADPQISISRMIAKKGVPSWDKIGKSEILSLEDRILHTKKTVDRFMSREWLEDLTEKVKSNLGGRKKLDVVFTRAYENGSLNLIPPAMAAKVQNHLIQELPGVKVSINDAIFQASKANRTGASNAATLLSRQQIFEGAVEKDTAHVLVDEHIEAGATLRGLDNYIRKNGGHVSSIATLTKNPGAEHTRILPETLKAIEDVLTKSSAKTIHGSATKKLLASQSLPRKELLHKMLGELGLKPETLTNTEGLAIVAHLSSDKLAFDKLLHASGTSLNEFSKYGGDYVANLLSLPAEQKTLGALIKAVHKDIGENYQYIGKQAQQALR